MSSETVIFTEKTNRSKNNPTCENAVAETHGSWMLLVIGSLPRKSRRKISHDYVTAVERGGGESALADLKHSNFLISRKPLRLDWFSVKIVWKQLRMHDFPLSREFGASMATIF